MRGSSLFLVGSGITLAITVTVVFAWVAVGSMPERRFQTGLGGESGRAPGPTPIDAVNAARPVGVSARLIAGDVTVDRTLPALAFRLVAGQTLDARLPAGPFTGTFDVIFEPGRVRDAIIGADLQGGQLIVRVDDRVLLSGHAGVEPVRLWPTFDVPRLSLPAGHAHVTYEFTATGDGPHALRALWRPDDSLAALPLPSAGASLVATAEHRGMTLAQKFNCVACHRSDDPTLQATLNPHPGPWLGRVGGRVRVDWLRAWLRDPHAVQPGTRMPHVDLGATNAGERREDLVHFLVSLGGPIDVATPRDAELVPTGRIAYHRVGCFACHGALEPPEAVGLAKAASSFAWASYVALPDLAAKTTTRALATFLRDPLATHPAGLMPGMSLSDLEARAIAAYLIDATTAVDPPGPTGFTIDPGRVARGHDVFAAAGCANCHDLGPDHTPIASTLVASSLETIAGSAAVEGGCLAPTPAGDAPGFALRPGERRDLTAFLASVPGRRSQDVPLDALASGLRRLNCTACHAYSADAGPEAAIAPYFATAGEADLGDEGRLPPDLTDAGARLTDVWMHEVLVEGARARSYLAVRMPSFGARAVGHVPGLFVAAGGVTDVLDETPTHTIEDATIGRALTGDAGFNCIQCHTIAGRDATGTPGPDLALMPGRLRYDGFARWLHDPARMRPGTRMPTFFFGGLSAITDKRGGRAEDQIDAIWAYLSQGELLALPEGLVDPSGLELAVGDEPVVFRTFMHGAGVRAIACGFPERVHYAFDADRCEVTLVWQGRFLSAQGAWGARGGNETNPEADVWAASNRPLLEIAAGDTAASGTRRFRGYELNAERRPLFRYDLARLDMLVQVVESPRPVVADGRARLVRVFRLTGPPGTTIEIDAGDAAVTGDATGLTSGGADGRFALRLDDDGVGEFELEVTW